MIQKNLYWENFFENVPKWSNRKVITKKSYLEDFLIFSPAVGHPAWLDTKKNFGRFFQKIAGPQQSLLVKRDIYG